MLSKERIVKLTVGARVETVIDLISSSSSSRRLASRRRLAFPRKVGRNVGRELGGLADKGRVRINVSASSSDSRDDAAVDSGGRKNDQMVRKRRRGHQCNLFLARRSFCQCLRQRRNRRNGRAMIVLRVADHRRNKLDHFRGSGSSDGFIVRIRAKHDGRILCVSLDLDSHCLCRSVGISLGVSFRRRLPVQETLVGNDLAPFQAFCLKLYFKKKSKSQALKRRDKKRLRENASLLPFMSSAPSTGAPTETTR